MKSVYSALCLATALVVLLAKPSDGNIFKTKTPMEKEYDLLNAILVQQLDDNNDPAASLLAAMQLLKVVQGEAELPKDQHIDRLPNKEALLLFTSLLQLMDPSKPACNVKSMNTIHQNEQACGKEIVKPVDEIGHMRRVEDIVHQIALSHASVCRQRHPKRLSKAIQRADPLTLKMVTGVLDAVIDTSPIALPGLDKLDSKQVRKIKAPGVSWKGKKEARAVLDFLRAHVDESEAKFLRLVADPMYRDKWIVNEKRVKEILTKHLFDGCTYFQDKFYTTVAPASLHDKLFNDDNKFKVIDSATGDLVMFLVYYPMCYRLTSKFYSNLEGNVIKIIRDER